MPSETWNEDNPLVRKAARQAHEFDFFQLLHVIEQREPSLAQIGKQGPAAREPVRLRPVLHLGFPPGDIAGAEWIEDGGYETGGRLRITSTFLGLYGARSPAATHFTEALLRETEEDVRVREFLDLFHHRILSLLYRVWKKYRYYVVFQSSGQDPISMVVRGLLGIATADLDSRLGVHPVRLFRYAGLLSQRPRSAAGLIGQLSDYFEGVDFDVEQCVGRWLRIEDSERNVMGQRKCSLGRDFLLGERIYDSSGKFRVKVGPVGFDDYTRFLPSGDAARDLANLCRFYCVDRLDFDLEVTLRGAEVPQTPLAGEGMLGRLSWTSWLKSRPCEDKAVVFNAPPARSAGAPDDGGARGAQPGAVSGSTARR
jgi:type VI secretion system protein ImpH